jgi:hypothetical protein
VTGQGKREKKNLHEEATGQEKVLRDKRKRCSATEKVQVTDLRPVKKVLRD